MVEKETWLYDTILFIDLMHPAYQVFLHVSQISKTDGGVLLANHSNVITREKLHLEANGEIIWASVHIKCHPNLYLGEFYRPQLGISVSDKLCLIEIDQSFARFPKKCHIILAGDFYHMYADEM